MRTSLLFFFVGSLLLSCSSTRQISKSAHATVLNDPALQTAHIGISIYEPAANRWWYNYQGDKYFVPASNTKIATCYAAMKYLGDSVIGARYILGKEGVVELFPSGDPTLLHPDFSRQPVFAFLQKQKSIRWDLTGWQEQRWGSGWSWNDYDAAYMAERSPFPIYGNVTKASVQNNNLTLIPSPTKIWYDTVAGNSTQPNRLASKHFRLERALDENVFYLKPAAQPFVTAYFPLRTEPAFVSQMLKDTLRAENVSTFTVAPGYRHPAPKSVIYSHPIDSLLKPLMHRSDNFFAEQALLMVSNEVLGYMSDEKIIDTILKSDFKNLPQKPRWADGSGLSRYNLFSPQDFVAILQKIKTEFGMARVREIFPTGNEGTLANYYRADSSFLYAKTGTLSGVVALSGYMITQKGRELIFSVLVNNHQTSATQVRRAVEKFVQNLRKNY